LEETDSDDGGLCTSGADKEFYCLQDWKNEMEMAVEQALQVLSKAGLK
jgi:hypothetical protein